MWTTKIWNFDIMKSFKKISKNAITQYQYEGYYWLGLSPPLSHLSQGRIFIKKFN